MQLIRRLGACTVTAATVKRPQQTMRCTATVKRPPNRHRSPQHLYAMAALNPSLAPALPSSLPEGRKGRLMVSCDMQWADIGFNIVIQI
jgi:hypothetical protein